MDFRTSYGYDRMYAHHARNEGEAVIDHRHCHRQYELLYVVEGAGTITIEGEEYPLRSGCLILIPPIVYHHLAPSAKTPYERFVFNFSERDLSEDVERLPIFADTARGNCLYFAPEGIPSAVPSALSIFDAEGILTRDTFSQSRDARPLISAILAEVCVFLSHCAKPASGVGFAADELVVKIASYITTHLTDDLSLETLARTFFIDKYEMCRRFKETVGTSVHDYIISKRINSAERLIFAGMSAQKAATAVGYRDYTSFYRAYRNIMGHTPRNIENELTRQRVARSRKKTKGDIT